MDTFRKANDTCWRITSKGDDEPDIVQLYKMVSLDYLDSFLPHFIIDFPISFVSQLHFWLVDFVHSSVLPASDMADWKWQTVLSFRKRLAFPSRCQEVCWLWSRARGSRVISSGISHRAVTSMADTLVWAASENEGGKKKSENPNDNNFKPETLVFSLPGTDHHTSGWTGQSSIKQQGRKRASLKRWTVSSWTLN